MKKFLLASAVAAALLPAAAFAQTADTQINDTMGATGTMQTEGGAMGTTEGTSPGGAMGAGAASPTSDTTGSYTIVTKTLGDVANASGSDDSANRNTDPAAVQGTIDANPGLGEKLEAEGLTIDRIASISVLPNGQVTVYTKS